MLSKPPPFTKSPSAPTRGSPCTQADPGTHDGVGLGTAGRGPRGPSIDGVEPGHTISTEGRSRVRMLLSFQRPSHLFGKGFPSQGRTRNRSRFRSGPTSIALHWPPHGRAGSRDTGIAASARGCAQLAARPERRRRALSDDLDRDRPVRGRSSKSSSTICCQVPSASRPSTIGIVSEGPISAARRWAWALVSWLRRLCS